MARLLRLESVAAPAAVARAVALRSRLAGAGLPFGEPIDALEARHGAFRWFDFVDVIRLDGLEVLGLPAADWHHRLARGPDELAAAFYADFWLAPDERDGHEMVAHEIAQLLGPGVDTSRSNMVSTTWALGFVEVNTLAFPSGLQSPSVNPLEDRHPELKTRTMVEITSRIADPTPDPTLAGRYARAGIRMALPPGTSPISPASGLRLHLPDFVVNGPEVWADDLGVAVSVGRVTSLLDGVSSPDLVLDELTPARGGGQATLDALGLGGRTLRLAWSSRWDALRPLAEQLRAALDVPLIVAQQPDE